MLEAILPGGNPNKAYRHDKSKRRVAGIDGRIAEEEVPLLEEHKDTLIVKYAFAVDIRYIKDKMPEKHILAQNNFDRS